MKAKNNKRIIAIFILFAMTYTSILFSQTIPQQISYHGKLFENGKPVSGLKNFNFAFVDTNWSEKHENIQVSKGMYSVILGSINPIPSNLFDTNASIQLKVTVNGIALEPEIGMLSTAYAFKAEHAAIADRLKGNSVYVNTSSFVGIGTNDPKEKLDVNGGLRIGSTNLTNAGTIRWTGYDFEGFNGKEWISLTKKNNKVNGTVIRAVAGETLKGAETPVPVYMSKDGLILKQTLGNSKADVFSVNKYAQIFVTDVGTTEIKKIALKLEKIGNPSGNVDISFHALYDNNFPTTYPIDTISVVANEIVNGWNEFIFDNFVSVSVSTRYAIVVSLPNGEIDNHIKWIYSNSNVYDSGIYLESNDYGANWTATSDKDFLFKLFSNNRVYACSSSDKEKIDFIGFAINHASMGEKITIQTDGIVNGFQNLRIGKKYYIQNISGTIGQFPGLLKKLVAVAVNEKELSIFWSDSVDKVTQQEAIAGINDTKMMTPKKTIDLISNVTIDWNKLINVPNGLSDGDNIGITNERDPLVNLLAKAKLSCLEEQTVIFKEGTWICGDLQAGKIAFLIPSNNIKARSDSEITAKTQKNYWRTAKTIQVWFTGKIRVSFDYKGYLRGYGGMKARIYVNENPVGEEKIGSEEWQTFTEDIDVNEGDKVHLCYYRNNNYSCHLKNFRLMWDKIISDIDYTIIKDK